LSFFSLSLFFSFCFFFLFSFFLFPRHCNIFLRPVYTIFNRRFCGINLMAEHKVILLLLDAIVRQNSPRRRNKARTPAETMTWIGRGTKNGKSLRNTRRNKNNRFAQEERELRVRFIEPSSSQRVSKSSRTKYAQGENDGLKLHVSRARSPLTIVM
jgi:hypothetical protein